jgi:hypothetical protein
MSVLRNQLGSGVIAVDLARRVKLDIADAVAELAKKRYGWDGESALPVRQDVIEEIRDRLLSPYGMDMRHLPMPDVSPSPDGTVALYFRIGHKCLTVHVKSRSVVHCFIANGSVEGRVFCMDKLVRMALGSPATGYAAEIDEWADWLLGLQATE